jgi:peroxiredoxin
VGRENDQGAGQHGCVAYAGQGITWQESWGAEPDPEALIDRLIGKPLPTTGLPWAEDVGAHPDVPLGALARVGLAQLAARGALLVYLAPAEDATDREDDTMGRALRDVQYALHDLGVDTVGIATQPIAEQYEHASIELFTQQLLSDLDLVLAKTLGVPFTTVNAKVEYQPIILIALDSRIAHVIYPIASPRASAQDALDWLTQRTIHDA